MYKKIIFLCLIIFSLFSCSKDETVDSTINDKEKALAVYQEAVEGMNLGDFFFASKKFDEAELMLPSVDLSAKSAILSSYCLYRINFYEQSEKSVERFLKRYPLDKHMEYARYLSAVISYEQILDEKKDLSPLLNTKKKIEGYIVDFPNNEYSLDLKFKLDLVNNQLAAKELYIAKYYIKTQKWIPAINRLKIIVKEYDDTIFTREALHRLVEVYYRVGLRAVAEAAAAILGYNYQSSEWYERSYSILNKEYKIKPKKDAEKKKNDGLNKRTIKKILS